jgi:hypothetical protein
MASPHNMPHEIRIEYDSRGKRVVRRFTNPHKAKQFWILKDRIGKRPTILKPKNPPTHFQPNLFLT